MEGIRAQLKEVCEQGLFRAASPSDVLSGFGQAFELDQLGEAASISASSEALKNVEKVDIFVSHSWSSSRWSKYLGLCMFWNLRTAALSSLGVWISTLFILMAAADSPAAYDASWFLLPLLLVFPMSIFLIVFFFGQNLRRLLLKPETVWVDRLCVDQEDADRKVKAILSLPVFVAHAHQMLVLWDDSLFERLWCNLELATFARTSIRSVARLSIQPLWLAQWLVSSLAVDMCTAVFFHCLIGTDLAKSFEPSEHVTSLLGQWFGPDSNITLFLDTSRQSFAVGLGYVPQALMSWYCLRQKLENHRRMLAEMTSFDVKAAKCTDPADRPLIEKLVKDLFESEMDEAAGTGTASMTTWALPMLRKLSSSEPYNPTSSERKSLVTFDDFPEDICEGLELFNAYVQGPLRQAVVQTLGNEVYMPLHLCIIACLPMILYVGVDTLGCENYGCRRASRDMGFDGVGIFMVSSAVYWIICYTLIYPTAFPLQLRVLRCLRRVIRPWWQQIPLELLGTLLTYIYVFAFASFAYASLMLVFLRPSMPVLLMFLFAVTASLLQFWYHFSQSETSSVADRRRAEEDSEDEDLFSI